MCVKKISNLNEKKKKLTNVKNLFMYNWLKKFQIILYVHP